MSGVKKGINDIATVFPDFVREWDYDKNKGLTPDTVAAHSNKKIWWRCNASHSYEASPDHRSRHQGCPYCSGKRVLEGFNDLKTTAPELAIDWDYERNSELLPTNITAYSNKKIWWSCHICNFKWKTSPNSRMYGTKKCPQCAEIQRRNNFRKNYLQIGVNDLVSQAPELLSEWDSDLNIDKNPADYTVNSNEKVWWKCKQCGNQWLATISNRVNRKSGCPKCKRHERTSFPEQAILFYVQKKYEDAENSYNGISSNSSMELDVFIPEMRVGIEYDGVAWHNNTSSKSRDHKKYLLCQKNGIRLIRVSEFKRENELDCDCIIIRDLQESDSLNTCIKQLLQELGIKGIAVNVERDRPEIMKQYISYIEKKSIAVRYPNEVKYWDLEKNNGLTPEMVNATTNIKYWWKCDSGHSYKSSPGNRLVGGRGCPYCSGRLVIKGYNDLQTKYPDIAKEWDYEKNAPLLPSDVPAGTQRKVWWKCDKGHSYQRVILNKVTYKSECPYCTNHLTLSGFNDIATTNPDLLSEWDYEKNKNILPITENASSTKKAWWLCNKGHSWEATINSRIRGAGCPYCCNRYTLPGYNDLLTLNPDVVKEWDYKKNDTISPNSIGAGSARKVWWICTVGHSWRASVVSRTSSKSGCPYCANQLFKQGYNDLKTMYPDLVKEWNYDKNGDLMPENTIAGGTKKVWWRCYKGHEWEAAVSSRIYGRGCPYCSHKKLLPGYNDFATVYPELLTEWNYEKNGDIKPENISCGSNTKIWWKCKRGHEWYLSPNQRRRKDGSMAQCIYCAGKKAIPGETDLYTVRPDLIKEWNFEKNTAVQPSDVKEFSAKKVWWKCSKCGYEWQAVVSNRSLGSGCPACYKSRSV